MRRYALYRVPILVATCCQWICVSVLQPHGDISMTLASRRCVFLCVAAGLSDIGRVDWGGPGPHEVSLSDECQLHDAEHQLVVHSGARGR